MREPALILRHFDRLSAAQNQYGTGSVHRCGAYKGAVPLYLLNIEFLELPYSNSYIGQNQIILNKPVVNYLSEV